MASPTKRPARPSKKTGKKVATVSSKQAGSIKGGTTGLRRRPE